MEQSQNAFESKAYEYTEIVGAAAITTAIATTKHALNGLSTNTTYDLSLVSDPFIRVPLLIVGNLLSSPRVAWPEYFTSTQQPQDHGPPTLDDSSAHSSNTHRSKHQTHRNPLASSPTE
jgi:hypothetical protein